MVATATTPTSAEPTNLTTAPPAQYTRPLGVVPTASMIVGAVTGTIWFWIPLALMIITISSIPSVIGTVLGGVVFVYAVRATDHVERLRSEAVFGFGIAVPGRKLTLYSGFQGWAHQLWLDVSSGRFWKVLAHSYLRMAYDIFVVGLAFGLLVFALLGPAAASAIHNSDAAAGLTFMSPLVSWLLAVVALAGAAAILVFGPRVDAVIDQWLLPASPGWALQHEVSALNQARRGAVSSASMERYRIERDLHDSVQPRLVALAMTIGLAQTKLDSDLPEARKLIAEAHGNAKAALLELRNVVRGIAPTILADRGLDAALSAVVQRTETAGVPVTLELQLPKRFSDEVESCAYFVVAESLTNIAKHAKATHAVVTVRYHEPTDELRISVFDDGVGGAKTRGEDTTGLRGLGDRVRAARGTFAVSSPETGTTTVTAVLPCAL
ncbi:sensor histidine kinase [Mycolicibacterium sp. CBMA 361]|uniref:sensor histidine kinase n=1 Tax=Mycolicibacterium sp. CBMA 361 TaxID=2606610 RepID=UPI0012DE6A2D|nr:sensor histidine kinase [Mycolicibacterium sp. CBMA 361]MUM33287.1 sensor histidine kinase [Mycolicibacterium sp. CBMA 361]